jgi:hypothetical protein
VHRLRRKRSSPRFDSGPNNRTKLTALRAARYPERSAVSAGSYLSARQRDRMLRAFEKRVSVDAKRGWICRGQWYAALL